MRIYQSNQYRKSILAFLLMMVLFTIPDFAHARTGDPFAHAVKGLCNVVAFAQNGPVKALLVIIVMFMGVGAFFGKVNWGLVVQTIVGISAALGAGAIAKIITGVDCELADMGIPNAPGFGDSRTCEGGNDSNECFPAPF